MPTVFILEGCPFSFKLLLFLSEARLLDRVTIETVQPESQRMKELKQKIQSVTGKKTSFPTMQIAPDEYQSDSDALISYFSSKYGIDAAALVALTFYKRSILPQLEALHS
jgi:hypothetical protein